MLRVNDEIVDVAKFPDGTPRFEFNDRIRGIINRNNWDIDIEWKYESDEELFYLCCLKDWIDGAVENKKVFLHMSYIPNARMDRVRSKFDVFTLKTFCKIINSLHFSKIYVTDAHSSVSVALLDNCVNLSPSIYIEEVLEKENIDLIFYPDEGSAKRYSDHFDVPYMFGIKKRDWNTGEILGLTIETNDNEYKGKNVLIVDDICSYGGTIYYSSKALKDMGVGNVYVFVTHCEDSILKGKILDSGLIEKVYTTNSLISKYASEHQLIKVV